MVICNLQRTQFDDFASLIIRGHIDDIFHLVMEELGIEIPMTTPEGYEVTPYEDKIDEKHLKKVREMNEKLNELGMNNES